MRDNQLHWPGRASPGPDRFHDSRVGSGGAATFANAQQVTNPDVQVDGQSDDLRLLWIVSFRHDAATLTWSAQQRSRRALPQTRCQVQVRKHGLACDGTSYRIRRRSMLARPRSVPGVAHPANPNLPEPLLMHSHPWVTKQRTAGPMQPPGQACDPHASLLTRRSRQPRPIRTPIQFCQACLTSRNWRFYSVPCPGQLQADLDARRFTRVVVPTPA
jgi:hypothetical protein